VSGYTGETVVGPGRLGGGAPFLGKPFTLQELLAAVRKAPLERCTQG
jgi:hypothetical protein